MNILDSFQQLDRALQLPITVPPATALLLWFGQPDLLNVPFIAQAGGAVSDNLALVFTIGVASSWSEDSAGAAVLVGAVGYLILTKAMVTINPIINTDVLAGIITGLVGDTMYNRWLGIKLPNFLSFFGGKRFMPVATSFSCPVLAATFDYIWPPVQNVIHAGGEWIVGAGALGSGIFGFINRLPIPTDLHQVLNIIAWFRTGELANAAGTILHGDINRFYVGDDTTGIFMSDFFLIMMFGLPSAALAIYFAAPKARRPMVGGMLLSATTAAFLTGVTEPLEFLFMFLALLLRLPYALLTGISLLVATLLGTHTGFPFSVGAIDCTLMYDLPVVSQNTWMLVAIGLMFFVIYFVPFSAVTRMSSLKTLSREDKEGDIVTEEASSNTEEGLVQLTTNYIAAVDGTDSLRAIDACITRLRLIVADSGRVNDTMCKRLGVSGVVRLNKQTIQAIVGVKAESIGDETKKVVACSPVAVASGESASAAAAPVAEPQAVASTVTIEALASPTIGDVIALDQVPDEALASKTVGNSMTVKPVGKIVVTPAAGTIVEIFNTNHALYSGTVKGVEIVVHMGIDTVALGGRGSRRLAEEGAEVTADQPIPEVDLESLNASAHSMTSPIVCSNSDDFDALVIKAEDHIAAGQTPLYEIRGK